ncbi:hypothetical protein [Terracoccus luteus]|uniref:Uncharacterized protein n=1 Tax=Terracoccus luteus TaxID=53356 RepID=A0A839PVX9_9MICO|nr:hypothetical protein [Terracoccus luteus]MBB2986884.1 hypothetical protein [Terracoccus luteus]MCP2172535.1 hypothetical protein [Terracoccus luteus]
MILHLRAAVEELYSGPPDRFTARRGELVAEAKDAGDKDLARSVGRLRRPTLAAWAVNHLVRTRPDDLDELRRFAELLREAQRTLDGEQLRLLGRERARRVDALGAEVESAAADAGHPLGASAAVEVRDTLTALIADEDAERAVLTGALVKALQYSGFGSVDLDDVVAIDDVDAPEQGGDPRGRRSPALRVVDGRSDDENPVPGREDDPGESDGTSGAGPSGADRDEEAARQERERADELAARRAERRAAARRRLASALEAASAALHAADRRVAVLQARQEEVTEGVADLERRLAAARQRLGKVTDELDEATAARDTAQADEATAARDLQEHDGQDA